MNEMVETLADLDTIPGVSARISQVIEANDYGRGLKPGARRLRASALADLFEIRAHLFVTMDLTAIPSGMLQDVATATARAAEKDRDSVRFWRSEASRR
jgi:hypothetical protein